MKRIVLVFTLSLGLVFSGVAEAGKKNAKKKPKGEAVEAPAEPVALDAVVREALLGVWLAYFNEEQQRQFDLMALALRDPTPTQEELEGMKLSEEEKVLIAMMMEAKSTDPDGEQMRHLQTQLDSMKSVTMSFEKERLVFTWGDLVDESSYEVIVQGDGSLRLKTLRGSEGGEDIHKLVIVEENTIHLTDEEGETLVLRRKK
jgi:hypothetical protein